MATRRRVRTLTPRSDDDAQTAPRSARQQREAALIDASEVAPNQDLGLCVSFFDAATGEVLHPKLSTGNVNLWLRIGDNKQTVTLQRESKSGRYEVLTAELEYSEETVTVEMGLSGSCQVNCSRYVGSSSVTFQLAGEFATCGCIPIPLLLLEETCTLRFRAYDCSFADWVHNGDALLNNVGVVVTLVNTPNAHQAGTGSRAHGQILRAQTSRGLAEIYGLRQHHLYAIQIIEPQGYLTDSPGLRYRYIGCETMIEDSVLLCPCGQNPARTIVFVREECPGVRWADVQFEANGNPTCADPYGVWNVPPDTGETLKLSFPGLSFQPSTIDLTGSQPVFSVTVAERTQKQLARKATVRHLDENGHPIAGRGLRVEHPDGKIAYLLTGSDGAFEAEEGTVVCAEQDHFGPQTSPLTI